MFFKSIVGIFGVDRKSNPFDEPVAREIRRAPLE